jgi:hypothetical protein
MTPAAAIAKCRAAYTDTFEAFRSADPSGQISNADELRILCASAYKSAMPALTDWTAIRAHIACVSQALLLGVLSDSEAKTLMFTAQTQLSTFAKEEKHK